MSLVILKCVINNFGLRVQGSKVAVNVRRTNASLSSNISSLILRTFLSIEHHLTSIQHLILGPSISQSFGFVPSPWHQYLRCPATPVLLQPWMMGMVAASVPPPTPGKKRLHDDPFSTHWYMGSCQNYGPFLGPYYNTAPII